MIHRWHAPHYELVAVYLWPWLFWQLWQIDRWTEYTGRQVFVEVDRQGRAYSTWWEGMDLYWDEETGESYRPWRMSDLQDLLPGTLGRALSIYDSPGLPISAHPRAGGDLVPFCSGLAEPDSRLRGNERALWNSVFGLPPPVP